MINFLAAIACLAIAGYAFTHPAALYTQPPPTVVQQVHANGS
jgi:hypothetical protein